MKRQNSNPHVIQKYKYSLPLLLMFGFSQMGLGQSTEIKGTWFGAIKNNEIHIEFSKDENKRSSSSTTFLLNELSNIPKEQNGEFKITREAGSLLFNGKFDDKIGTGSYVFTPAKGYSEYMNSKGLNDLNANDLFAFLIVDIKKDYVQMLLNNGYKEFTKNELIPLAALDIDEAYIKIWKQNGYTDIKLSDLIPLKSLGVTAEYINGFSEIGYKNISASNLIPMKSLGII